MKINDAKIHERSTNNEAVRIQKRNNRYLFLFAVLIFSYGFYDMFFKYKKTASLFLNPFTDSFYLKNNYPFIIGMFLITIIIYLFHFGKMDKKYVNKLEKLKQSIFNFLPFYFSGNDERNLYFRFGLQASLKNNFLERKVHKKNYLTKVQFLSVFINNHSPHKLFSFGDKTLNIGKYFHNENDFLDLFKIIEGYLIENKNIDIFQNQLSLNEFKAIGSYSPRYTIESIEYYLNNVLKEQEIKKHKVLFENILKNPNLTQKEKNLKIKDLLIEKFGEKGFNDYKIDVSKMVVFSSSAIQEILERIYFDAVDYFQKIKIFKTNAYQDMLSFSENIDEDKIFDLIVFTHFFKIINLFMGLPSGIVTARVKDYDFARIIDDLEHFEQSQGIREIKRRINDNNAKYNDTFARTFMIFYHDYYKNSKNRDILKDILIKFNPLVSLEISDIDISVPTSFGEKVNNANYIPKFYNLPDEKEDIENIKKQDEELAKNRVGK